MTHVVSAVTSAVEALVVTGGVGFGGTTSSSVQNLHEPSSCGARCPCMVIAVGEFLDGAAVRTAS
jgi:hypothetical protein